MEELTMDKYQTLREKDNPSNNVYPNIKTQNIPDEGVTTPKIDDDAITTAKIADGAITTAKIVDGAVTTAKISDGSITNAKLGNQIINTANIADNAVTTDKIANGSITSSKIASGVIGEANSREWWFKDTDFSTMIEMIQWIEYQLMHNRKPLYNNEQYISSIDCISTDTQEITIKCSVPLQGINTTETLNTDSDVEDFYNSDAGNSLLFVGA